MSAEVRGVQPLVWERPVENQQGMWEQLKKKICLIWEAIVFSVKNCLSQASFWVFRVADYFNPPTISSRIEGLWLYASQGWSRFWFDREKGELTEENQRLREQVGNVFHRLQSELEEKGRLIQQRDRLSAAHDSLRSRFDTVSQDREAVLKERDAMQKGKDAVQQDRNALVQDRDTILQNYQALIEERNSLVRENKLLSHCNPTAKPFDEVLQLLSPEQKSWLEQIFHSIEAVQTP